jgi:nucleotide-binding universal stress UspA family protein
MTGKEAPAMYEKILVPLDGSALAERALLHAAGIARGTRAEILLLQAIYAPLPVVPEPVLLAEGKMIEEAAKATSEYLERIGSQLREGGHRVRTMVEESPPADAILRVADREMVDLIIMSTHGRSGLSRLMMGSIAESVLRNTHRTVMLVKPDRPAATEHPSEEKHAHVS